MRRCPHCGGDTDKPPALLAVVETAPPGDQAIGVWNEWAERLGWPVVQKRSKERVQKAALRLDEIGGLDGWRNMLADVEQTPWLRYQSFFTFDWVVKPANLTKIMERNYAAKSPSHKPAPVSGLSAVLAELGRPGPRR